MASSWVEPVGKLTDTVEASQPFLEQGVDHGQEQQGVGARPDEVVAIGQACGLGPSRIDHHHRPTAVLDGSEPALDVGCGHAAAVGHGRVGTR